MQFAILLKKILFYFLVLFLILFVQNAQGQGKKNKIPDTKKEILSYVNLLENKYQNSNTSERQNLFLDTLDGIIKNIPNVWKGENNKDKMNRLFLYMEIKQYIILTKNKNRDINKLINLQTTITEQNRLFTQILDQNIKDGVKNNDDLGKLQISSYNTLVTHIDKRKEEIRNLEENTYKEQTKNKKTVDYILFIQRFTSTDTTTRKHHPKVETALEEVFNHYATIMDKDWKNRFEQNVIEYLNSVFNNNAIQLLWDNINKKESIKNKIALIEEANRKLLNNDAQNITDDDIQKTATMDIGLFLLQKKIKTDLSSNNITNAYNNVKKFENYFTQNNSRTAQYYKSLLESLEILKNNPTSSVTPLDLVNTPNNQDRIIYNPIQDKYLIITKNGNRILDSIQYSQNKWIRKGTPTTIRTPEQFGIGYFSSEVLSPPFKEINMNTITGIQDINVLKIKYPSLTIVGNKAYFFYASKSTKYREKIDENKDFTTWRFDTQTEDGDQNDEGVNRDIYCFVCDYENNNIKNCDNSVTHLGDIINTPYDERNPYLSADGRYLFFSSNGHGSIGGQDIFYVEFNKEKLSANDEVKNILHYPFISNAFPLINTPENEFSFTPSILLEGGQKQIYVWTSNKKDTRKPQDYDVYAGQTQEECNIPNISFTEDIINDVKYKFTVQGVLDADNISWNFGDDSQEVVGSQTAVEHTYEKDGRYTVSMTVQKGNCRKKVEQDISVIKPNCPDIPVNHRQPCDPVYKIDSRVDGNEICYTISVYDRKTKEILKSLPYSIDLVMKSNIVQKNRYHGELSKNGTIDEFCIDTTECFHLILTGHPEIEINGSWKKDTSRTYAFYSDTTCRPDNVRGGSTVYQQFYPKDFGIAAGRDDKLYIPFLFDHNVSNVICNKEAVDIFFSPLIKEINKGSIQCEFILHGYADITGDSTYNKKLSSKRINTVADYLKNKIPIYIEHRNGRAVYEYGCKNCIFEDKRPMGETSEFNNVNDVNHNCKGCTLNSKGSLPNRRVNMQLKKKIPKA